MAKAHFDRRLFRFLNELAANNDRAWFEANKQRYIEHVRDPMLGFITAFGPRLAKISSRFIADPRPHGGSMFRIYRDTRFAKDKSPYKTSASAQFRHESAKDVHAPGFYLHLQPGECFVGAGLWHPDAATAKKIRQAIAGEAARWKRITRAPALRALCTMQGDALQRPPRGFDPEHELIEDLKRKDFITVASVKDKDVCSEGFLNHFTKICRANARYVEFLTQAVGLRR